MPRHYSLICYVLCLQEDRIDWARDQCKIIKEGEVFHDCRLSLSPAEEDFYYDNCVNDAKEYV